MENRRGCIIFFFGFFLCLACPALIPFIFAYSILMDEDK
jgi:hypothetical protein